MCVRAHCRGAGSSCDPVIFPVVFGQLILANIAQSPAISHTVNLLLLQTIVLTLAIISSFLDVDGRPERGLLSAEVLPSLNRRNQSNNPLHLHRMLAAIIDTFPLWFFRF